MSFVLVAVGGGANAAAEATLSVGTHGIGALRDQLVRRRRSSTDVLLRDALLRPARGRGAQLVVDPWRV